MAHANTVVASQVCRSRSFRAREKRDDAAAAIVVSMRRAVTALLVCLVPIPARADLMKRVLDSAQLGGGTSKPAVDNDLLSWAGEPKRIALGELLEFAVRQAPSLANARLDIDIANAQITETWARNDWQIKAQLQGQRADGGFFDNVAIDNSTSVIGNVDLIRLLPTGSSIDLHASSQYNDVGASGYDAKIWTHTVTGSITQPLLKGRGRFLFDANERKAELSRDVTVLAKRLAAITTVQGVVSAYWDLVLAERQVAITEESLGLVRERLRITQIGADGGKVAKSEIPAVQQIIATREEDVLTGQLAVLQASIALRRAVGMPIGAGDLGLRVDSELDIADRVFDLGPLLERAYAASPELAELAKQRDSATIDIAVTENGLLPQLDAALTIGPTGQDPPPSNTITQPQQGSAITALKDMVEFKQLTVAGTLTFSRSLGQHDVRGRAREQRLARDKLTVNAFDIRAQYASAMSRAVAQIELAKRRVVLSQRAIDLANENIRIETDRFNLGRSTNFDVLNRHEELRQAELRQAQAQIDWHKAETAIQALTGDILPTFGIHID
jgi:outer membrane protein TolC